MKKAVLIMAGTVVLSSPAFAQTTPAQHALTPAGSLRLERLTMLYETFEAGFAYIKHCGDLKKFLADNPNYTANAQMTLATMSDEINKQNPDITRESVGKSVLTRSTEIQKNFDGFYKKNPNACISKAAQGARAHVDQFSAIPPKDAAEFLKNIEKR